MSRPKKILVVGPKLTLPGGVSHHIKTLLNSPLSKINEIHFIEVGSDIGDNYLKIVLKFLMMPVRFLWKLWVFWPDVVHFNPSFDYKSLCRELTMLAICKLHRCPSVVQFHGGTLSLLTSNGYLPVYLQLILKWSSHLVVLTNLQKTPLINHCPENKISVIPNMVDTAHYRVSRLRRGSSYNVLYMSKMEYKKGIYDVVRAIPDVLRKFPDVKFLLAGEGPDLEKMQRLCHENKSDSAVTFLGYVTNLQKVDFLARGDVFLFPSHYCEGMPYALLEAMASGLPIIASQKGGIPEIIEHNVNGYLIPPDQPQQLAQAIIALLSNDHQRIKFGQINRHKAETIYDIKLVSAKFDTLYEQLSIH